MVYRDTFARAAKYSSRPPKQYFNPARYQSANGLSIALIFSIRQFECRFMEQQECNLNLKVLGDVIKQLNIQNHAQRKKY